MGIFPTAGAFPPLLVSPTLLDLLALGANLGQRRFVIRSTTWHGILSSVLCSVSACRKDKQGEESPKSLAHIVPISSRSGYFFCPLSETFSRAPPWGIGVI